MVERIAKHNMDNIQSDIIGYLPDAITAVDKCFASPTGRQVYRKGRSGRVSFRNLYCVQVLIEHNHRLDGGFLIITAYPIEHAVYEY